MFADLTPNLGETVVKLFAVAGGVALGALLGGVLVQLLVRLAARRPAPRRVVGLFRVLGAALLGMAVYMFVFGTGGGGLGGSGWGFGGGGTGTGVGTGSTAPAGSTQPIGVGTRPATSPATQPERAAVLAIEMLGGKRYKGGERFYLVETVKEPVAFADVRKAIEERAQGKPPLQGIEIIIREEDSVSERDPAVEKLKELAKDLRLAVKITTP